MENSQLINENMKSETFSRLKEQPALRPFQWPLRKISADCGTHRVDSSQQHLSDAGVDLSSAQLVGGEQVGEVQPLHRLSTFHPRFDFSDSFVDERRGCGGKARKLRIATDVKHPELQLVPFHCSPTSEMSSQAWMKRLHTGTKPRLHRGTR